jgi:hypothetical protein
MGVHYGSTVADDRKRKGGRVTPKGGAQPSGPPAGGASGRSPRRPDKSTGQVGKRPSRPLFLLAVGLAWIICGVVALLIFKPSWRYAVGVVFIGIGLFWVRGAMATISRHDDRLEDQ